VLTRGATRRSEILAFRIAVIPAGSLINFRLALSERLLSRERSGEGWGCSSSSSDGGCDRNRRVDVRCGNGVPQTLAIETEFESGALER